MRKCIQTKNLLGIPIQGCSGIHVSADKAKEHTARHYEDGDKLCLYHIPVYSRFEALVDEVLQDYAAKN